MNLKHVLLGLSVCTLSLTASAQSVSMPVGAPSSAWRQNIHNRPLGLNDFKHLSNDMLQAIGKRVSALGHPTIQQASRLLKANDFATNKHRAAASQKAMRANYTAQDTLFWESFEGWDKTTMPWIPADNNWQTKSNIDDLTPYLTNDLCPTWTTYQGDGYYVPYATHRDQMLVCMYGGPAYDAAGNQIAPAPQQDEWIVSPTISAIDASNYISFDICYSPWDMHYFIEGNDTLFDVSRYSFDVELLVTTSTRSTSFKAEDYDVVYKLSSEVDKDIASVDMEDADAVAQLLYMNWHHIQIPLKEYDGKNIRFAFRYTGTKGGSIMIDAVRVSDLLPQAMYDIPEGSFYYGFGETGNLFSGKLALLPAYTPLVWKNYSNADSQSFEWSYITPTGATGASTDADLQMPALESSNLVEMPKLTAVSGKRSDTFAGLYYKAGGSALYMNNGEQMDFFVGNFDPSKQFWLGQVSANPNNPIYAFGTGAGALYGPMSNYYYNSVDGIGNFFDTPAAPYVFNRVLVPMGEFLNLGATLACTIYKVENGNTITDEVLAQATLTQGTEINGGWFLIFEFPTPLVIDEAIFVMIEGISNSALITFAPLTQALNHDSQKSYAFVKLNTNEGKFAVVDVANLLSSVEGGGNMFVSHCIGLNAVFPYVHSLDGSVFAVADAGEEKTFQIDSYWNPSEWELTCSDTWFKAEAVVDETAQTVSVKVKADALPAALSGRRGQVKIVALGCEQVIEVVQGDAITSIDGIMAGSSVMTGIYNLNGQLLNSAGAKRGLYLEKKNGKFVKVLK